MKKIYSYIYMIGGLLLIVGAALYITAWSWAPYLYLAGAFMFGSMQMADRYTGTNWMIRRLRRQQILGAIVLMITGIVMLTCKHNEWVVCLFIGCLLELYTAFRIPQEYEKEKEKQGQQHS